MSPFCRESLPILPNDFLVRLRRTFRSLHQFNYRIWALGSLVSNIGSWMQRIAQDWLVLANLTDKSATAVGLVMALQFGPPILLMPWVGKVVDRVDRRKLLLLTQSAMCLNALCLGILVLAGVVALWHVYLFAAVMGCISAFDSPVRQTFVAELVGEDDLSNAVALNATLFHGARLVGPAVAGIMIAVIGSGWVFIVNALSFVAVVASLCAMRTYELRPLPTADRHQAGIGSGFAYIGKNRELIIALVMLFLIGTYGLNFPIFISTMSVTTFHGGPHLYGTLSSAMGVGSVAGGLFSAGNKTPNMRILIFSSLAFGIVGMFAAIMPSALSFGVLLIVLGVVAQIFTTSTNALVQLSTKPEMRGRVMTIYMGIFLGCTPLGSPLIGWVADTLGPRWALSVGAASGLLAGMIGTVYFLRKEGKKNSTNLTK